MTRRARRRGDRQKERADDDVVIIGALGNKNVLRGE